MPEARLERTRRAYEHRIATRLREQDEMREREDARRRDEMKPLLEQRWRLVEDRATT